MRLGREAPRGGLPLNIFPARPGCAPCLPLNALSHAPREVSPCHRCCASVAPCSRPLRWLLSFFRWSSLRRSPPRRTLPPTRVREPTAHHRSLLLAWISREVRPRRHSASRSRACAEVSRRRCKGSSTARKAGRRTRAKAGASASPSSSEKILPGRRSFTIPRQTRRWTPTSSTGSRRQMGAHSFQSARFDLDRARRGRPFPPGPPTGTTSARSGRAGSRATSGRPIASHGASSCLRARSKNTAPPSRRSRPAARVSSSGAPRRRTSSPAPEPPRFPA